jgi:hypothetical protein
MYVVMVDETGVDTIARATKSENPLVFNASTGTLTSVNFETFSDVSLKHDIDNITNALDIVDKLQGMSFTWNSTGNKSFGFIAQEVEKVLPEIVGRSREQKTVSYVQLIPILVQAIKELKEQIKK